MWLVNVGAQDALGVPRNRRIPTQWAYVGSPRTRGGRFERGRDAEDRRIPTRRAYGGIPLLKARVVGI
jgi:hypothetical protein